ncbi:XrtA/PEP-CTERM system histidine kinase PrsK [Sphingomonas sp. ASV193]|uniref:XrtA/PEP-CTERM system histidine kinase PrsK n=1 Tax=Sphingomonas sp. ASV193 TaxID=3144405 RepID=UPI0032E85290
MNGQLITFWSHGLAAALFASLTLWELRRGLVAEQARLLAALALTCVWAWITAVAPSSMLAAYCETARNLAWVGVLYRLTRSGEPSEAQRGVNPVYAAVAGVLGMQLLVDAMPLLLDMANPSEGDALVQTALVLRITAAAGALVLVHNAYGQAAPSSRSGIRLAMLALALMWAYDLNLFTVAYFDLGAGRALFAWRGLAIALTAPLLAMAGGKREAWRVKLSRAATFQSLSMLAIGGYFAAMAIVATATRSAGEGMAKALFVSMLVLMTVGAALLIPSRRMRAWAKVKVAKHLFEHRYDYRSEWLRFADTLGASGPDSAPFGERVVKAFADILDSPGGLLLVADELNQFEPAASWHWRGNPHPTRSSAREALGHFWRTIEREGRIVDFEARRNGWGGAELAELAIPADLLGELHAWIGVPLIHQEKLVGLVILDGPDYRRPLDWEDFDLLRTAGRQAASSLSEATSQHALMNAQRFEDFNRRFAFILHDIKNLVSQLSLVARNAERHADNPEFRADMIATLKSSVGKMNDLLQRIAPQKGARAIDPGPVELLPLLSSLVAGKRLAHPVTLKGDAAVLAMADRHALEQAVGHLVQNAIDASPPAEPVEVRVSRERHGIAISIADHGAGMDADFVRTRLFQPFASTKDGGFGVGAFEARELVAAMNGRLTVESRPGEGTRFTIHLPAADPAAATLRKSA